MVIARTPMVCLSKASVFSFSFLECGELLSSGWSRIFTTGLTIMGSHLQWSYQNGVAHFRFFGGKTVLRIYG